MPDNPVPTPDTVVGSYVLLERLGAGGVGEVWKARDRQLNRVVALKFLAAPRAGSSSTGDLLREARAASALNHPNIITIFEVGERDGATYLAMEFIDGETLRTRMARGGVPLDEALAIAAQVVDGLASAHAQGIVHRDLKPENIMLRGDGYVKLVDFGLAKVLAGDQAATGEVTASSSGQLAGTFTYMSPEQARSQPVSPATDVFAFGIVMYELLTGDNPFRRETILDTLNAIVGVEPPGVQTRTPAVPRALADIVSKALQKDPAARYPSAVAIKEPLKQTRGSSSSAVGTNARRRAPRARIAAAAALLTLLVLLVWVTWAWQRPASQGTAAPVRTVAVMTFRTDPADAGAAPFADGLPEELGGALAANGFRVASRSSVVDMGAAATAQTAGSSLGVDAVVEGTVRSSGARFRIHIELVDARTRFQIWSGTFTTEGGDLLTSAQSASAEIAKQLRAGVVR